MAEIDYGPIIAGMRGGTPGPRGEKGDTGIGWGGTPLTNTADLNTLKTPGLYSINISTVELTYAATQTLNYPPFVAAVWSGGMGRGVLKVSPWAAGQVVQEYTTLSSNNVPNIVYRRTGYANSWSKWYVFTQQRVDNTAGRAIYTWDDTANREQLIYGDTGWRNVKENLLPDFTASSIRIRRTGSMVTVGFDGLVGINSGHATFLPSIAGFAADSTLASAANQRLGPIAELTGANVRWVSPEPGAGALRILSYVASVSMHGFFTYFTADPWPTVLPGISNGPTSSPA